MGKILSNIMIYLKHKEKILEDDIAKEKAKQQTKTKTDLTVRRILRIQSFIIVAIFFIFSFVYLSYTMSYETDTVNSAIYLSHIKVSTGNMPIKERIKLVNKTSEELMQDRENNRTLLYFIFASSSLLLVAVTNVLEDYAYNAYKNSTKNQ